MEPTSLIYLPDGTVLDPVAVAAIHPASESIYFYYRLLGDPVAYAVEAETHEHALELRAYMVACKELATPARVHLDGDVERLIARSRAPFELAEPEPIAFDARWAEWWGDREGYYIANPYKWLTDAERVCRHFFDEGRACVEHLDEPEPTRSVDGVRLACLAVEATVDTLTREPGLHREWMNLGGSGQAHYHDAAAEKVAALLDLSTEAQAHLADGPPKLSPDEQAYGEELAATIGPTATVDSIPMGLLNATWSGDTEFPSLRLASGRRLIQADLATAALAAIDDLTEARRCSAELANDITEALLPLRASLEAP